CPMERSDAQVDDADRGGHIHRPARQGEPHVGFLVSHFVSAPTPGRCRPGCYMTAPSCQGANSSSPNPSSSLAVFRPEATSSTRLKICSPSSATVTSPSRMAPQSTSMSSDIARYVSRLLASFRLGAGRQPYTEPRPVVKQIR